jgi:signal recognition particle subunit SEC65
MPKASIILLSFLFAVDKLKEGTTRIRTGVHGLIIESEVDAEVRSPREERREKRVVNTQHSTVNSPQLLIEVDAEVRSAREERRG